MAQTKTHYFNTLAQSLGLRATEDRERTKRKRTQDNFMWFLNKTAQMFEYENLPKSMPKIALETILQSTGSVVVWRVPEKYKPKGFGISFENGAPDGDSLYAFPLNLSDAPDPYQESFRVIITNPGFEPSISETLEINKDCVVFRSDTTMQGVAQIHWKYAELLTEAEISLRSTLILLRDQITFIAKTQTQRANVAEYIKSREAGDFASILAPELGSPLEAINHDGRSNAVELAVNGVQAIKSAWYNEIGLNPSFSLKREYTSAQEIDTNTDLLMPIVDDMFINRQVGVEAINRMFGTNITVKKSSAWGIKEEEIDNALELEEVEIEAGKIQDQGPMEGVAAGELSDKGSDEGSAG